MAKTKVTLSIEEDIWKQFRIFCIQQNTNASETLTEAMTKLIKEKPKRKK